MLNDSGLAAHLLGAEAGRLIEDPSLLGHLLEGFVFAEIKKQSAWSRARPECFHFRAHTGQEVDLVLEDAAGHVVGIEVKAGVTVTARDFLGLQTLAADAGKRFLRGVVLHAGRETIPFGRNLHALPLDSLWRLRRG
jgi:predicted AAA+ superfamily ATPase